MTSRNISTTTRALAIGAGVISAGTAVYMIVGDAIRSGVWSLEDVILPVIVILTIIAGHMVGPAVSSRRALAALGWFSLAVLGTSLTVYTNVGRQAKVDRVLWSGSPLARRCLKLRINTFTATA